jgi:hypothetical protein
VLWEFAFCEEAVVGVSCSRVDCEKWLVLYGLCELYRSYSATGTEIAWTKLISRPPGRTWDKGTHYV